MTGMKPGGQKALYQKRTILVHGVKNDVRDIDERVHLLFIKAQS